MSHKVVQRTVRYQVKMQSQSHWSDWKHDDDLAGAKTGDDRIEAIRIRLETNESDKFYLVYKASVQGVVTGWVDEDKIVGTVDQNKRMDRIQLDLVNAPEDMEIYCRVYSRDVPANRGYIMGGNWAGTLNKDICGIKIVILPLVES